MRDPRIRELLKQVDLEVLCEKLGLDPIRRGTSTLARCPFHDDNKPSLQLYPATDQSEAHYHCFACNAHGDAIHLVKQCKSADFGDALQFLGYRLERPAAKRVADKTGNELVWQIYRKQSKQRILNQFLAKRHFAREDSGKFEIAATDGNILTRSVPTLSRQQVDSLEQTGLLRMRRSSIRDTGKLDLDRAYYDFFGAEAVIFPIRDADAKIVGFAARAINPDPSRPRYMYSPGFPKSQSFYRIDRLLKVIRDSKPDAADGELEIHVYLVEGFMDVLRLETLGFLAIGLLGSRLSVTRSESQIELLGRAIDLVEERGYAIVFHLFLDGDAAGLEGTYQAIPALARLSRKHRVSYVDIVSVDKDSEEKDPDDVLKGKDHAAATDFIKQHKLSPLEFCLEYVLRSDGEIQDASTTETSDRNTDLRGKWESLPVLRRSREIAKLRRHLREVIRDWEWLSFKTEDPTAETANTLAFILDLLKPEQMGLTRSSWEAKSIQRDLYTAIEHSKSSRLLTDFPVDLDSWERMQRGLSLYKYFFQETLSKRGFLTPGMSVLHPRTTGEPRLKVLPCPEDLVRQTYFMCSLFQYPEYIPGVWSYRTNSHWTSRTVWHDLAERTEVVSFAYQLDRNALERELGSIFVPYARCWEDFNRFVLRRVKACTQQILHPSRHDIHRYYDRIPFYAVADALRPALTRLFVDTKASVIPGIDDHNREPQERVHTALEWLQGQLFHYSYEDPTDGSNARWPQVVEGIPQGPDLSAWIATIVLFPLDSAMLSAVDEINERYQDPNAATYARYVDDIVLLAPTAEESRSLQSLLAGELKKLRLELSKKTEPEPPATPAELFEWMFEGRGLWRSPSEIEVSPVRHDTLEQIRMRLAFGKLERPEALLILHSDALFDGALEFGELRQVLEAVVSAPDLKHRDDCNIARCIWWYVLAQDQELDDAATLFADLWHELRPGAASLRHSSSDKADSLQLVIPLLIWLEGLERLLLANFDQRPTFGFDVRNRFSEVCKRAADMITDGLTERLAEFYRGELQAYEYLFNMRSLNLRRMAAKISEKADQLDCLPSSQFWRYSWPLVKEPQTIASQLMELDSASDPLESLKLFHLAVLLLSQGPSASGDSLDLMAESLARASSSDDQFSNALSLLVPNSDDRKPGSDDARLRFDATEFLLTVAPREAHSTLLQKRPHLLAAVFSEGVKGDWRPLTPLQGISEQPLLALREPEKVEKQDPEDDSDARFGLIEVPESDELQQAEVPELCPPFDERGDWLRHKINLPLNLWTLNERAIGSDGATPLLEWVDMQQPNDDQKLSLAASLFDGLVRALNLKRDDGGFVDVLYSAENVLLRENATGETELLIFGIRSASPEDNFFAFAGYRTNNARRESVPARGAALWRAGTVVADVLDCYQFARLSEGKRLRHPDNEDSQSQLSKDMLHQGMSILIGGRHQSKPRPGEDIPRAVEDAVERMRAFAASANDDERYAISLTMTADVVKMAHRRLQLDLPGYSASTLYKLAPRLLPRNALLQEYIARKSTEPASDCLHAATWVTIGAAFSETSLSVPENEALGLADCLKGIAAACYVRATTVMLRNATLALLAEHSDLLEVTLPAEELAEWGMNCSNVCLVDPGEFDEMAAAAGDALGQNLSSEDECSRLFAALKRAFGVGTRIQRDAVETITPLGWIVALSKLTGGLGARWSAENTANDVGKLLHALAIRETKGPGQALRYPWNDLTEAIEVWSSRDTCEHFLKVIQQWPRVPGASVAHGASDEPCKTVLGFRWERKSGRLLSYSFPNNERVVIQASAGQVSLPRCCFQVELLAMESFEPLRFGGGDFPVAEVWVEDRLACIELISPELLQLSGGRVGHRGEDGRQPSSQTQGSAIPLAEEHSDTATPESSQPKAEGGDEDSDAHDDVPTVGNGASSPPQLTVAISQFCTLQETAWRSRTGRVGRHIRVGMLQFYGGCSYDDNHEKCCCHADCVEQRRRQVLKAALKATDAFLVDVLVLPEYSVSEETVRWLRLQLDNYGSEIAIWAGTYRRTNRANDAYYNQQHLPPLHAAVLPLLIKQKDAPTEFICRWKKYPAIAFAEEFSPYTLTLEPLFRKTTAEERCFPGQRVLELICSEAFFVLGPLNAATAATALQELMQQYDLRPPAGAVPIEQHVQKDAFTFSKWMGSGIDPRTAHVQREPMKYFPRRTILLVPSVSPRDIDYGVLGHANYLSSGGTMVFCNGPRPFGNGHSSVIGHDCLPTGERGKANGEAPSSPYHGLFPGVYPQCAYAGPLDEKEEALVIVDIDPDYAVPGKPRPQGLPRPLNMIAHLPIIQRGAQERACLKKNGQEGKKRRTPNELEKLCPYVLYPSVNEVRIREIVNKAYLILSRGSSGTTLDATQPHQDALDLLRQVTDLVLWSPNQTVPVQDYDVQRRRLIDRNKHLWLVRREMAYLEKLDTHAVRWPAPALYDWLLVPDGD